MAMSVTVQAGDPGRELIVLPGADLTAGAAWSLVASYAGGSHAVRGGSGTGDGATQVALVDARCPLNVTVTYTLTVGATVTTATATRTYSGDDAITSLDGDTVVDVFRRAEGGDRREPEPRFHVSAVPGSRRPPMRLAPVAGDGGGSLLVETDSTNSGMLGDLISANRPVLVFHNPSVCGTTGCTVPLVDLAFITRASSDALGGTVTHSRDWSLSYLLAADPEPDYRVPLSTWDEFDAAALTWDQFDALGLTWDQFDLTDWSTVGA